MRIKLYDADVLLSIYKNWKSPELESTILKHRDEVVKMIQSKLNSLQQTFEKTTYWAKQDSLRIKIDELKELILFLPKEIRERIEGGSGCSHIVSVP